MSVYRPSQWDTYYQQEFIESQDIIIYDYDDNILLTSNEIQTFKRVARNSYVCGTFPMDEITIEIIGWDNLDNYVKNYLQREEVSLQIKIQYLVNNYASGMRRYILKDCRIEYNNFKATITATTPLECMTDKSVVNMSLIANNTTGYQFGQIVHKYFPATAIDYTGLNDYGYSYLPNELTDAEMLQHFAVVMGGGLTIYNEISFKIKKFDPYQIEGVLYDINIFDDIKIEYLEKKQVEVLGYIIEDARSVVGYCPQTTQYSSRTFEYTGDWTGFQTYPNYFGTVYNCKIFYSQGTPPASAQNYFTISAYKVNFENSQAQNKISITAKLLPTTDSTQKSIIKGNAQDYYDYNKIITFSCRLDPTIEPLDVIRLSPSNNIIVVEEIELNYNGGFNGKLSGRLIWDSNQKAQTPIITNIGGDPDTEFHFTCENPNPFDCTLVIEHSGEGHIELYLEAGETTVFSTDDDISDLFNSFNAWYFNDLADSVICYFESDYSRDSDYVVILEES